jgi:hypothetical protein
MQLLWVTQASADTLIVNHFLFYVTPPLASITDESIKLVDTPKFNLNSYQKKKFNPKNNFDLIKNHIIASN